MPNGTADITTVSARLPVIVSIVIGCAAIVTSYTVMGTKLATATDALNALRNENSAQHATITQTIRELEGRSQAQERLIVELTTTLRVKGILR